MKGRKYWLPTTGPGQDHTVLPVLTVLPVMLPSYGACVAKLHHEPGLDGFCDVTYILRHRL